MTESEALEEARKKISGLMGWLHRNSGIPQKSVAAQLEVEQSSVSNWVTGRTVPRIENFLQALDAYGVDLQRAIELDLAEQKRRSGAGYEMTPALKEYIHHQGHRLPKEEMDVILALDAAGGFADDYGDVARKAGQIALWVSLEP